MKNQGLPPISDLFDYLKKHGNGTGNKVVTSEYFQEPRIPIDMAQISHDGIAHIDERIKLRSNSLSPCCDRWNHRPSFYSPSYYWQTYPEPRVTTPPSRLSTSSSNSSLVTRSNSLRTHSIPASHFYVAKQAQPISYLGTNRRSLTSSSELGALPSIYTFTNTSSQDNEIYSDHERPKLDHTPNEAFPSRDHKEYCKCQESTRHTPIAHIPRPRNAFILFRQHWHKQIFKQEKEKMNTNSVLGNNAQSRPFRANSEASRDIGHRWRKLSDEERQHWIRLAEQEKEAHRKKYPDYRYVPVRKAKRNFDVSGNSKQTVRIDSRSFHSQKCTECGRYKNR